MNFKIIILVILCGSSLVYGVFDQDLYESVLDAELCQQQLNYVMNNTLLLSSFLDSGIRTPRGILKGNLVDLGNYYQCLEINDSYETSVIQGKYCSISIPLQQNISLPSNDLPEFLWSKLFEDMSPMTPGMITLLQEYNSRKYAVESSSEATIYSRVSPENPLASMSVTVSVCIPQSCTTRLALATLMPSTVGLEYRDNYCRLPNDKSWATADTVAAVVFGTIGLLTLLSSAYDLRHTVFLTNIKKNPLYTSFSIFTNTRRLLTVAPSSNSIDCLDGLRVFAISWVVLGHVYNNKITIHLANPLDVLEWLKQYHSIFISAAPITVDTFFFLSGLLVVYTTVQKVGRVMFIKNVHIFYLLRLLRMFPLLAAAVLLQASWFNHVADGPYWQPFASEVRSCRNCWWQTLLYVQNYMFSGGMCLAHSWYLAVDMQAYIISPLVLFWVMGSRRSAWYALSFSLAVSLGIATTLNAIRKTQSSGFNVNTLSGERSLYSYYTTYYMNTLNRVSPFFVGMIFGYLLLDTKQWKMRLDKREESDSSIPRLWHLRHELARGANHLRYGIVLYPEREESDSSIPRLWHLRHELARGANHLRYGIVLYPEKLAAVFWILWLVIILGTIGITYPIQQAGWDSLTLDVMINSFMRPLWGAAIGWMIFACANGYGGPINWILSLRVWKVPARLSYGVYMFHLPIQNMMNSTILTPIFFDDDAFLFTFFADIAMAFFVAFMAGVLIDAPFSTLTKIILGGGSRKKNLPDSVGVAVDNDHEGKNQL